MTIVMALPGLFRKMASQLGFATDANPHAISATRNMGIWKLDASVSTWLLMPGNFRSNPHEFVSSVLTAPSPMMPCGWYANK